MLAFFFSSTGDFLAISATNSPLAAFSLHRLEKWSSDPHFLQSFFFSSSLSDPFLAFFFLGSKEMLMEGSEIGSTAFLFNDFYAEKVKSWLNDD